MTAPDLDSWSASELQPLLPCMRPQLMVTIELDQLILIRVNVYNQCCFPAAAFHAVLCVTMSQAKRLLM